MPTIRPNLESGGGEKRTTFRPPWVKDGPCPLPAPPTNPWLQQVKQEKKEGAKNAPVPAASTLKKPNEKEVIPSVEPKEGPTKQKEEPTKQKVEPTKQKVEPTKQKEEPIKQKVESTKQKVEPTNQKEETIKPKEREIKIKIEKDLPPKEAKPTSKTRQESINKKVEVSKDVPVKKTEPVVKKVEFNPKTEEILVETNREVPKMSGPPPPPPPMAPPPPPMAPPPPQEPKKPVSKEKAARLESLRSRPRRRPDWTDMMKEVEQGIRLKHVQCNDRSAPIIPSAKAKGQFVYDSEKPNSHNNLLKEIEKGVRLKKTKTNDRSKPMIDGLRKFRRQMTIEDIITKSASVADVVAVASEPDELDDIDKVRDDLQSTKQMLALELRNKEALERDNKRLLARLANLEAELEKEKQARKATEETGIPTKITRTDEDDKLITKLKEEAAESAKMAKEMEDKYKQTAEELDLTRAKLESAWLKNAQLEMELKSKGKYHPPLTKQASTKKMPANMEKKLPSSAAVNREPEDSDTVTESESEVEEEEDEVMENTSAATHEERELKLLNNKLKTLRDKKTAASNEKKNLKQQLSKLQHNLKDEKKKYKLLQKEVEKMASIMKDVEGEGDEEEHEDEEEEDEETEEETETESESEDPESEEEVGEDANHHEKVRHLNVKIKALETRLTRDKKGNYLLKANIERKQDDLNRQKEMSLALQEDLNAVLSELG